MTYRSRSYIEVQYHVIVIRRYINNYNESDSDLVEMEAIDYMEIILINVRGASDSL